MKLSTLQIEKLDLLYCDYNQGIIDYKEYLEKQNLIINSKLLSNETT